MFGDLINKYNQLYFRWQSEYPAVLKQHALQLGGVSDLPGLGGQNLPTEESGIINLEALIKR